MGAGATALQVRVFVLGFLYPETSFRFIKFIVRHLRILVQSAVLRKSEEIGVDGTGAFLRQ